MILKFYTGVVAGVVVISGDYEELQRGTPSIIPPS